MIDTTGEAALAASGPAPYGFRGISVPVRDVQEAKDFYLGVLGGELVEDGVESAAVTFGDFVIGFGKQDRGSTPREAEYPHYAFTVDSEAFIASKKRLDACGIPTHEPWTRQGSTCALMYFRDPSSNQYELYCPEWSNAFHLRVGARAGGDYVVPFESLNYEQLPAVAHNPSPGPKSLSAGFNHMTLPVRDMHEGKRFLLCTLGGSVKFEHKDHITVYVGGAEVGQSPAPHGWTLPDAEFPHYTLLAKSTDLLPIKRRLESFDVPTTEIWTRTGTDALVNFRDPSGTLWELHSDEAHASASDRKPDVTKLNYGSWKDPG